MNSHTGTRTRKLLIIPVDHHNPLTTSSSAATTTVHPHDFSYSAASTPIPPPLHITSSSSSLYTYSTQEADASNAIDTLNTVTEYKQNSPLEPSMTLTLLILLTAFFFMGFLFSIYIRRFTNNELLSTTQTRRITTTNNTPPVVLPRPITTTVKPGVDPDTIQSLPVYQYDDSIHKRNLKGIDKSKEEDGCCCCYPPLTDCVICLTEYEDGEYVKTIPYCKHFFHAECIDAWLVCHVTCPLCRTKEIFPRAMREEESLTAVVEMSDGGGGSGLDVEEEEELIENNVGGCGESGSRPFLEMER